MNSVQVTDVELLVTDLLGGLQRLKGQVDVLVRGGKV